MNHSYKQSQATMALVVALALVSQSSPIHAASPIPGKETSAVNNMLGGMWAKLRASVKRPAGQVADASSTVAGIRGSEATESELRPYWKGAREGDKSSAEVQAFNAANELAEARNYAQAAVAFDAIITTYPDSPLAPDALFGGALARAALGEKARAIGSLETFVKKNPQHPLVADAQQVLAALKGTKKS